MTQTLADVNITRVILCVLATAEGLSAGLRRVGSLRDARPSHTASTLQIAFGAVETPAKRVKGDVLDAPIPAQCDGLPLPRFTRVLIQRDGKTRRFSFIRRGPHAWPTDRRLERQNLAVRRRADAASVQCGDGGHLAFDFALDLTWRTALADPAKILVEAQTMLVWRAQHLDRELTGMLVEDAGVGRWPVMPPGWRERTWSPGDDHPIP
jgi:hypothetical protein